MANGYSEHFVQFVAKAREAWPTKTICAGNVVTGEMCEELILSGADIVKVGIGRVLFVQLASKQASVIRNFLR